MTAAALLRAQGLCCERDQRILFQDLSFSLAAGELLQVEGSNGSGKTSLLRILTGLAEPQAGVVSWCEQPIRKVRAEYCAQLEYLGHAAGVKSALTAIENLQWYARVAGVDSNQRLDEVLGRLGLRGFEDIPCYRLSAGQQRRVNLARLYLLPAKLWILDEPFTAIDASGVLLIQQLIAQQLDRGGAVVITSHQQLEDSARLRRVRLG